MLADLPDFGVKSTLDQVRRACLDQPDYLIPGWKNVLGSAAVQSHSIDVKVFELPERHQRAQRIHLVMQYKLAMSLMEKRPGHTGQGSSAIT